MSLMQRNRLWQAERAGGVSSCLLQLCCVICLLLCARSLYGQGNARQAKGAALTERVPQLVDITASTGIHFDHLSSPELKYIVESMSGGVALLDYDGDGWLDIYFTNAPSVSMALAGKKARSALFH